MKLLRIWNNSLEKRLADCVAEQMKANNVLLEHLMKTRVSREGITVETIPSRSAELVKLFPGLPESMARVVVEVLDLHARKAKDYGKGDDAYANIRAAEKYGIPAWVGASIRMADKEARIQKFIVEGALANEPVEDSIRDNAVYALIRLLEYRRSLQDRSEDLETPIQEANRLLREYYDEDIRNTALCRSLLNA